MTLSRMPSSAVGWPHSGAGIIACLLEGRQESDRAVNFSLWYAECCLYYQLWIYGEKQDALQRH